ncbi:MAG: TetR/AcrR family transcriptional regulator [Phycisphaeraceae bacterium]|nr:MAG: TetR/AcrR family transcriptional regulator [Phycisphaeraceae bacterium]
MAYHASNSPADDTRERLLHAAGHEFARVGFAAASVRSICEAADANVSAVKYHYGSKESLYLAVWAAAAEQMVSAEPMPRLEQFEDPKDALRAFVAWFMRLVLTESKIHPWAGRLLAHETVSPTPGALDMFVKHCAGPVTQEISRIVKAIVRRPMKAKTHDDLVFAVVALCVNPKHSCEILTKLGHPPPDSRAGINRMARVMAEFAISGLTGFTGEEGD